MKQHFKEGQTVYFYYNVTKEILKGKIDIISNDDVWISHGIYITLTKPFRTKKDAEMNRNLMAYFNHEERVTNDH